MRGDSLRVLLADDHAVVRRGISEILHERMQVEAIGEASDVPQTLEMLRSGVWDVLILDISMPGRSGLEALEDIRAIRPDLPVLFMSMHAEDQIVRRVLRSGAAGYVTKGSDPDEIVKAVRKVIGGGRFVGENLVENLLFDLQSNDDRPVHERLSNREYEVLRMLSAGRRITEIAHDLALSVKTVSTYRARILEKLDLRNDSELIHYAVRNGITE
jgi:DNA-binding NarL/FixJ family response regulator